VAENGESIRLAAWQGRSADGDVDANLEAALRVVAEAGERGADFLCFPECFLSGYGSRESVERGAMSLDDPRLQRLADAAAARDMLLLVGLAERLTTGQIGNSMAIYEAGRRLGLYRKTMLTGGDARNMGFCRDYDLPVFQARGVTFGCIVCHDSSFIEPAAVMAYKGAQIIFSPHYNALPADRMDEHRIKVRNNHVGLAALLGVYVVRANVVGRANLSEKGLGYGDSAIFDPIGAPLAEAGLFREGLIVAEIQPRAHIRAFTGRRDEVPQRVRAQLAEALMGYQPQDPSLAPTGEEFGGRL
jgi:predicted amidohydrolase